MKKNISINISGIIFHIEEDGYSSLKSYLETINRYFSSYEDSLEIISDIESRIAEIFLTKLSDGKQVITLEDVEALIQTMGTIADFDAIESDDDSASNTSQRTSTEDESAYEADERSKEQSGGADDLGKKRLFRDERRKVLGGVAAGVAYFFSIDPLWVRLLMVALLINLFNFGFSGGVFLTYLVLWIVIPVSSTLGDEESVKKMFRNPENQVVGGIASGIAAYFGIDVTVVRLLFVLSIFLGGSGVILYIILWMITPVAKTITEKMQMQGEPVTLSNIQNTVTRSLKNKEGEESAFAKVLLFPFRVVSELFRVLAKLIGPLSKLIVNIVRVFVGIVIVLLGLVSMVGLLAAAGVFIGLFAGSSDILTMDVLPLEILPQSFSPWAYVAVLIVSFMPVLMVTLLGVSLLAKRLVISAAIGWAVLGVWLIGVVMALFTIPNVIYSFKEEGEYKEELVFEINPEEPLILLLSEEQVSYLRAPSLFLKESRDTLVHLRMTKVGRGKSRAEAIQNSKMITYGVSQDGNELTFDSRFMFAKEAKFRGQKIEMTLYVPYGKVFVMDDEMREVLNWSFLRSGFNYYDVNESNEWVFVEDGLKCVTCEADDQEERENAIEKGVHDEKEIERKVESELHRQGDENSMVFDLEGFDRVEVHGVYRVFIEQSDAYHVMVRGSDEMKRNVVVKQYDRILEVNMIDKKWGLLKDVNMEDKPELYITMPALKGIESSGLCEISVDRYDVDEFEVDLSGAAICTLHLDAQELDVELSGAAVLELGGRADYMSVDLSGASTLKGYDMEAKSLDVSAKGASAGKVRAIERLEVEVSGISNVRYQGDPKNKRFDESGMGHVKRSFD
ncbi:hypothetical protein BFP72_03545 [Reichenbachiella sp. 5M10]|uniref:PspC domain-containing protein n=1 Tax=Reichenbachiella sp. 5M10 TaxID=1889772 RepID=UPI000C1616AE|nr:DUF2807 domain-containing protein [Reichenbachiella sp. 5M10]PIB34548.1 hypothetical protein BFP72_03545 [Reichenbachiella sp. 5M10]